MATDLNASQLLIIDPFDSTFCHQSEIYLWYATAMLTIIQKSSVDL